MTSAITSTHNITCSWDVGIKTLSFCVIDDNGPNDWKVVDMGMLNLLSTLNVQHKCEALIVKNKKKGISSVCGAIAKHHGKNFVNKDYYLCNKHVSHYDLAYDKNTYFTNIFDKSRCQHVLTNNTICNKLAHYNADNINMCKPHMLSYSNAISNRITLKKIVKQTSKELNMQEIATLMYSMLDKTPSLANINEVRIENQPSKMNDMMKTMSIFLFSYFIKKSMEPNSPVTKVRLVSASGKLDIDAPTTKQIILSLSETDGKDTFSKKLDELVLKVTNVSSISTCKTLLSSHYDSFLVMVTMNMLNKKHVGDDSLIKALADIKLYDLVIKNLNKIHEDKDKIKYIITKTLGVKYAHMLLIKNNENRWSNFIKTFSKQDDLTDALLHGLREKTKRVNK
jgi:hypothetical protein